MRVLDLGCGRGLTSLFLAREFGVQVFAFDLWIDATENLARFRALGLEDSIVPIHGDANDMPFARDYFDAVISVDSYNFFGLEPDFLDRRLAPFLKPGGLLALAFPGFRREFHDSLPPELLLSWTPEAMDTLHSIPWWRELLSRSALIEVEHIGEMSCFDTCWEDWLGTDNPYAKNDRPAMEAGAGQFMNLIAVQAKKRLV